MQRLIALIVMAIALTPNTGSNQAFGAELGEGKSKLHFGPYAESFDGSYVDQPPEAQQRNLSRKTEKIMTYMARAGINGTRVKNVAQFMNSHIEDNNFRVKLADYKGLNLQFSHEISVPAANKFKLRLADDDLPHWEVNGSTRGVMLQYKYEW